ncbi:alpha/beta fold hydrolase [Actinoplanes sp. LDG1-06]|uniref:Alpha/beta fold hydrolase n=1 Tax=Paractinoplanes ovalisporus TaxID=2810368 RepID=A0ABS2AIU5_9ACTN|nr:alpha/beta hydrolase [Actinoplanes ovalisporus]MBM2619131.1 alpha/beta fold hydrolase [Actinoplanes ovalisporus]
MTLPESHELTTADGRLLRYCLYGPVDGTPAIFHSGSPSCRWKRPDLIATMERSKLRLLVYDRPGYGGSSRQPGRTVADAASDVRELADAYGWERFGIFGGSGGGPHALACAALLGDRVTRCAVLSGIKPRDGVSEESVVRSRIAENTAHVMAAVDAGGPEMVGQAGPPAKDDPDAMARLRATFVESHDGWADDTLAFGRPWGFDVRTIGVPVGVWRGTNDTAVPGAEPEWLLANIPGAAGHVYDGGHLPGQDVYGEIYDWLSSSQLTATRG